jgi:hypothetical protein
MSFRHMSIVAAAAAALGIGSTLHASMIPFSSSTFTLNHSTTEDQNSGDIPTISGGVLTLMNGGASDANSSFYTTPVSLTSPFTVSFVMQATNPTGGGSGFTTYGADGYTFTIAALSDGTGDYGGRGSGLGWGNNDSNGRTPPNYIANSVAAEYTIYPGGSQSFETGVVSAGSGGASAGNYNLTGVMFSDPTLVTITYTGTTVSETLLDTVSNATYTLPPVAENLSSIVGSSGYIGFTGGSGGDSSTVQISSLSVTPVGVPEPTSIALLSIGAVTLLGRRRRTA